ncbi:MAG: glucose-6-phosphate isomerase [Bacteroidota bacterium]
MKNLKLSLDKVYGFVPESKIMQAHDSLKLHLKNLHNKTGKGNDFLGWLDLPSSITASDLKAVNEVADELSGKSDIHVVIGIGGSYLGAKAVIEGLSDSFSMLKKNRPAPQTVFAGQNISGDYHTELLTLLEDYNYSVTVISKSGTTTEPALAFRFLKQQLEKKYGKKEASGRIVAVTDKSRGALKQLSDAEGYRTFVIPDDVGGRYSVLTPVGLLPVAVAGFDIASIIEGAKVMEKLTRSENPAENPAMLYAAARNTLYRDGKIIEILVNYHPKLQYFSEWWKQLYGESEGKEGKGIFPASVNFTTDLHSMGQYIQDGLRQIFETVISVETSEKELTVPKDDHDLDGLNYLAGKRMDHVNKMAELGTQMAHIDGGVPNLHISIPRLNEFYLGQLIYFFEKACALSGYMLGVNPFDQPGVEAYKKNMFRLLGKK